MRAPKRRRAQKCVLAFSVKPTWIIRTCTWRETFSAPPIALIQRRLTRRGKALCRYDSPSTLSKKNFVFDCPIPNYSRLDSSEVKKMFSMRQWNGIGDRINREWNVIVSTLVTTLFRVGPCFGRSVGRLVYFRIAFLARSLTTDAGESWCFLIFQRYRVFFSALKRITNSCGQKSFTFFNSIYTFSNESPLWALVMSKLTEKGNFGWPLSSTRMNGEKMRKTKIAKIIQSENSLMMNRTHRTTDTQWVEAAWNRRIQFIHIIAI